jgi:hypothetical protein
MRRPGERAGVGQLRTFRPPLHHGERIAKLMPNARLDMFLAQLVVTFCDSRDD